MAERQSSFAALDREMEKRHDLVKEKRDADNAQTLAHASGMRNEVQVMGTSPSGTGSSVVHLMSSYIKVAFGREWIWWPSSFLVGLLAMQQRK